MARGESTIEVEVDAMRPWSSDAHADELSMSRSAVDAVSAEHDVSLPRRALPLPHRPAPAPAPGPPLTPCVGPAGADAPGDLPDEDDDEDGLGPST